jgi:hypothetical protein
MYNIYVPNFKLLKGAVSPEVGARQAPKHID